MVRTLPPVPSSLRNRNRINNKSRLRIVHGNFDADSIIPDEDDEKLRMQQSVFGVDQDDANEHHLQAVLSEAALRSSRSVPEKKEVPAAYIPTPDSTGIVANYDDLYPPNKWKDPASYIYSSMTTEEACEAALTGGFSYFMDERDKEWLDKNNELARGEGTSAQGALSGSGTRTSARSAKAKGKEPESAQTVISEDEFELVMGLFEKTTHEKTEFLHHSLETGMTFPAYTEYQDVFASALPPATFATFTIPAWIPPPAQLSRIARVVYPYWKTRRLERGGHRVIPTLNFDETDIPNESYVCFRRRELKAVRKTRATQVTTSDKLSRLQAEFAYPLRLAETVLERENLKMDHAKMSQHIWEKRAQLVDLKRKNPSLGERGDEDLLIDKEKKKVEPLRPKNQQRVEQGAPPRPTENALRPKDRLALIQSNTENLLNRQKEKDYNWEDYLDCAYQSTPASFASRLFKFIPPSDAPNWVKSSKDDTSSPRSVRLRYGRGGRLLVDRRRTLASTTLRRVRNKPDPNAMDVDSDTESDRTKRLLERWKYDSDDVPAVGPWAEEQDRVLVDDYDHKNIVHTMSLLVEADHQYLNTNQSLMITTSEGQQQLVLPYRLGAAPPYMRGPPSANRFGPSQGGVGAAAPLPLINGAPVSISQQMRMQPTQMRIPSNGALRVPPVASMQGVLSTPSQPPPSLPQLNATAIADTNGVTRPPVDNSKTDITQPTVTNGVSSTTPIQVDGTHQTQDGLANGHIAASKSNQDQAAVAVQINGYHMTNGYPNSYLHLNGQTSSTLSAQQMQNLKTAFASPSGQDANGRAVQSFMSSNGNFNMQLTSAGSLNLKLPPARQWSGSLQRPNPVPNGLDAATMNGSISPTLNMSSVPRTPTTNGSRSGMRVLSNGQLAAHSLSPHQHSPSPIPSIAQSQSPPRLSQTPSMTVSSSPSMQH